MEKLVIQVPEKKSKLIKSLLKELGAVIEPDLFEMSKKLNRMVKPGAKPSMDEIINETRDARAKV
jgi:hypothetical protein